VPGPVKDGRAQTTNLPWLVETSGLAGAAQVEALAVINDLKAQAYGIAVLGPEDFEVLNPGSETASGNAALIAAGTGLGQAPSGRAANARSPCSISSRSGSAASAGSASCPAPAS
jgi:glucokinase